MKSTSNLLSFTDLLNQAVNKVKPQVYLNGVLTDVFTISDLIQREYRNLARLYLKDIVIPFIIDNDCDFEKLSQNNKAADRIVYAKQEAAWQRDGGNQASYTLKERLMTLQDVPLLHLAEIGSDILKKNLSEKLHEIYFEQLKLDYQKLKDATFASEDGAIVGAKLRLDYLIEIENPITHEIIHCYCTNKTGQGTGDTKNGIKRDIRGNIQGFKRQQPQHARLIVIIDFQTEKEKDRTKDWIKSYEDKNKILQQLRAEAGSSLNKTIFIGRFKEVYEQGCFNF